MTGQRNIVLISIDDMISLLTFAQQFGVEIHTPNLDALMARSVTFTNAYVTTPICNASRTAVLTGKSAFDTGVYSNTETWYDYVAPEATLPAILRAAGLFTATSGKVFHGRGLQPDFVNDALYSQAPLDFADIIDPAELVLTGGIRGTGYVTGPNSVFYDAEVAAFAASFVQSYAGDDPFALFVGFRHPHTDFTAPKEFYDLYDPASITVPDGWLGDGADIPTFAKQFMVQYLIDPEANLAEWQATVQGYLAAISHVDSRIGEFLDALAASNHADDTAILLYSDHGMMLGEKGNWNKAALWETASKVPLVLYDPSLDGPVTVDTPVSLLDIFPTIMELAGVTPGEPPRGQSLATFLDGVGADYVPGPVVTNFYGSIAVRDGDFRYIRYIDGSEELYDVVNDPSMIDNLAADPDHAGDLAAMRAASIAAMGDEGVLFDPDARKLLGSDGDDVAILSATNAFVALGTGDDAYHIHGVTSKIREEADGGIDTVFLTSDTTYVLPDNVEVLISASQRVQDAITYTPLVQKIFGNAGDNIILVNEGLSRVKAGAGNDHVELRYQPDSVGSAADGLDFAGFVSGEAGDDTLIGGSLADRLRGGAGDDDLRGRSGADLILAGDGADYANGGSDNDMIYGGGGNDRLFGARGDDVLFGNSGLDLLDGGDGDDVLFGGSDADALDGNIGDDWLYGGTGDDDLEGGDGADWLFGDDGNDTLAGEAGDDRLYGLTGDDLLLGGDGDDTLDGGDGADRLEGGLGADTLTGGADADVFVFASADAEAAIFDTIRDFEIGVDIILFTDFDTGERDAVSIEIFAGGRRAWVTVGDQTILLKGDDLSALSLADLSFG